MVSDGRLKKKVLGWALSYRVVARVRKSAGAAPGPTPRQHIVLGAVWVALTAGVELAYFEFGTAFGAAALLSAYLGWMPVAAGGVDWPGGGSG